MLKTVFFLYQDCPCCGERETWCKQQAETASKAKIRISKVPFYAQDAADVIKAGSKAGFSLPFYTDGAKFGKNIADFIDKPGPTEAPVKTKKTKRASRAKKPTEVKDEPVQTADGQDE